MTLLYIMNKGYPRDGLTDEYPDEFSFHEKFEKIENKLLGRNRWDVYDEMQEKAKKLAGKLLKEHFPETRQKADMKEKAAMRKKQRHEDVGLWKISKGMEGPLPYGCG